MLEGNGRINDECQTCGGLVILHKPGTCTQKDKNDEMLPGKVELKAKLFDRMEDFRMKRKVEEVKNESEMEKLCKMMGDNNKKLVESLAGVMVGEKKETVLTNLKNPPKWGDKTFKSIRSKCCIGMRIAKIQI